MEDVGLGSILYSVQDAVSRRRAYNAGRCFEENDAFDSRVTAKAKLDGQTHSNRMLATHKDSSLRTYPHERVTRQEHIKY